MLLLWLTKAYDTRLSDGTSTFASFVCSMASSSRTLPRSPQKGARSSGRPSTHARVLAMTHQDAQATPKEATDTLSISGRNAHILVDSGVHTSF